MNISALSDESLFSSLEAGCRSARRSEAQVIALLIEVEERRLDLRMACSSLWDFCQRRLGMSESETQRRITAARIVRRIPSLLAWLDDGRLHLSTLVLLRDHITPDNAESLTTAARGLRREKIEQLLARLAPRPDVPSRLRKLPTRTSPPAPSPSVAPIFAPSPSPSSSSLPGVGPVGQPVGAAAPRVEPGRLQPLSETRYRLQLTASVELRDKLERARALMRHQNPSGDLAAIVEAAMDLLLVDLEKKRRPSARTAPARKTRPVTASRTRHVPVAVKRAVFAGDGERCTFVDGHGRRCEASTLLELDHVGPFGRGGGSTLENLRVRCRGHNKLHAEASFGRDHISRQIDLRRNKSGPEAPR